jgi:hypothetical protein
LFLDSGTLDFGVVRDASLNDANRLQTFYEAFENVAFLGIEALNLTTQVCASGTAAALTPTPGCGGQGS